MPVAVCWLHDAKADCILLLVSAMMQFYCHSSVI
jgi:hypothetical protein